MSNYLIRTIPNFTLYLILFFIIGAAFYPDTFQFIYFYIIGLILILFYFRIPEIPLDIGSETIQVCNIDGTCRTISRSHQHKIRDIWAPAYGMLNTINHEYRNDIEYVELITHVSIIDPGAVLVPYDGVVKEIKDDGITMEWILETRIGDIIVKTKQGNWIRGVSQEVQEGAKVEKGQMLGFLHLSNRVSILLPKFAVNLLVNVGDRMDGLSDVIAHWNDAINDN